MLLATIHGKIFADADDNEDWLTSAVFGHLRGLPPGDFWKSLFSRARTVEQAAPSLGGELGKNGIDLSKYDCEMRFWPNGMPYGEPDLMLKFSSPDGPNVIVLVEIKLLSGKSGTGENDQLARYLRLLDRAEPVPGWTAKHRYLVYLTVSEGDASLIDSVNRYGDASAVRRLFALHWSDVQDVAVRHSSQSYLLGEVAEFLDLRNLAPFRGFVDEPLALTSLLGSFYNEPYFQLSTIQITENLGAFYGK